MPAIVSAPTHEEDPDHGLHPGGNRRGPAGFRRWQVASQHREKCNRTRDTDRTAYDKPNGPAFACGDNNMRTIVMIVVMLTTIATARGSSSAIGTLRCIT